MQRHLNITTEPIQEALLIAQRAMSGGMGAAVYFTCVARATEEDKSIQAIEYEAFQRMAAHQFNLLFDEMERRWPIESVRLVHRIGVEYQDRACVLKPGDEVSLFPPVQGG